MSQLDVNLASTVYRDRADGVAMDAEVRRIIAERNRLAEPGPDHHWSWWEGVMDVFRGMRLPGHHTALSGT
ncbi:hypothetical protein BCR15_08315 [Tessaracoccus lapidicaptus]|uniref:Uncharacterized protein n=1 Tax=Tessaracoccus lapidicaptus TaxID=1427523 RepID=A0A1C0AJ10_9ACTN|nr:MULTISPECIES: hypothetical protein [Tessaracoccus]AQX15758.1 hypothetical protein BKM78_07405 [Tessaracoccus sp. T2.5-30]OCL32037.1 hypothetical protein BCR15_08315 [Tessaracoccus lapidicaptus]VEP40169.1 hypothetical protein TLA_TLA_01498 [Tessaracoccus lapidicaptus]